MHELRIDSWLGWIARVCIESPTWSDMVRHGPTCSDMVHVLRPTMSWLCTMFKWLPVLKRWAATLTSCSGSTLQTVAKSGPWLWAKLLSLLSWLPATVLFGLAWLVIWDHLFFFVFICHLWVHKTNTANTALPLDVKDSGWKLMSQTPVGWSCGGLPGGKGLRQWWNMVKHDETVAAVVAVLCISWRPTGLLRTAPFAIELFAVEIQSDKVLGNVVNVFFLVYVRPTLTSLLRLAWLRMAMLRTQFSISKKNPIVHLPLRKTWYQIAAKSQVATSSSWR